MHLTKKRISTLSLLLSATPIICSQYPFNVRSTEYDVQDMNRVTKEVSFKIAPFSNESFLYRLLKHKSLDTTVPQSGLNAPLGATMFVAQVSSLESDTVREYSCPNNATLVNDRCVRSFMQKAHSSCPSGMKKSGEGCISYAANTLSCPPGYQLKKNQCVASVSTAPTSVCPDPNETLNIDSGLCEGSTAALVACPVEYTLKGGSCMMYSSTQAQCPEGYTLSATTQNCVRTLTLLGETRCSDGCVYNEGRAMCECTYQGAPSCPNMYTFNPTSMNCVALAGKIAEDCPTGHQFTDDGHCQRIVSSPATRACPTGYTLVNNACRGPISSTRRCPNGYMAEDGFCERIVNEVAYCEDGLAMVNMTDPLTGTLAPQCRNSTETTLTQCCETGSTLLRNSTCRRAVETSPAWSCEGECYTLEKSNPIYSCPDSTELSLTLNNVTNLQTATCTRNVSLEVCVTDVDAENCTITSVNTTIAGFLSTRRLQGNDTEIVDNVTNPCIICENITQLQLYTPNLTCPDGGDMIDNICVTPVLIESIPTCKSGVFDIDSGNCIEYIYSNPMQKCSNGGIPNGLSCLNYNYEDALYNCPDDATYNSAGQCVVKFEGILAPNEPHLCSPTFTCPPSEYLSSDGVTCNRVVQTDVTYRCPNGSAEIANEYCMISTSMIVPSPTITYYAPQYVCPDGSITSRGQTCNTIQTVAPTFNCPVNMVFDETTAMCAYETSPIITPPALTSSEPVLTCPAGTRLRDNLCYSSIKIAANSACTEGTLIDGRCVISASLNNACPKGSTLTPTGCLRLIETPAKMKTVKVAKQGKHH